jgi:hypothetical protein
MAAIQLYAGFPPIDFRRVRDFALSVQGLLVAPTLEDVDAFWID